MRTLNADQWAALLSLGGAAIGLGIGFCLLYESWSLWTNHQPITWIVRTNEKAHPRWVVLTLMLVAFFAGHFARF
jgi:hypothetical protein